MARTEGPSRSLAQRAYRLLREEILSCRLRPGEMVLGTRLATKYRMSRTPVHEALKLLCNDGLVRVIPRVGYVVTEISAADVQHVFQVRFALETLGADLAAQRVTPADIENFKRLQKEVRIKGQALRDDPAAHRRYAIDANREFHLMLATLSGNTRLAALVGALLDESRRVLLMDPAIKNYVNLSPPNDHAEVVAMLEAGDRQGARDAMALHMREGQKRIVGMLLNDGLDQAIAGFSDDPPVAPRRRVRQTARNRVPARTA